jgi:hypothetical protein
MKDFSFTKIGFFYLVENFPLYKMIPKTRQIGCGCESSQTKKYQFSARQKSGNFFLSTINNTVTIEHQKSPMHQTIS